MFEHVMPRRLPGVPGSAAWSTLKKLIWLRGAGILGPTPILKTAVGNPIHITDALARAVNSLKVEFTPIQDLSNGDPSPQNICPIYGWTGCGITRTGQNMFDISALAMASSWSYTDGVYTGTSANLNNMYGGTKYLYEFPNGFDGQIIVYANYKQNSEGAGLGFKFEYTDGTSTNDARNQGTEYSYKSWQSDSSKTLKRIAVFYNNSKTLYIKDMGIFAYVSESVDDYDFTYTESFAPVFFSSKNLFSGQFLQGYWAYANGSFISDTKWICTPKIPCKPNTNYVTSWSNGYTTRWQGFVWYGANGRYLGTNNSQSSATNGKTFKSPANAAYMVYNISGTTASTDISPSDIQNFQIEEGTTASAYEAPNIVYGGYFTINEDGTVTVTVDRSSEALPWTLRNAGGTTAEDKTPWIRLVGDFPWNASGRAKSRKLFAVNKAKNYDGAAAAPSTTAYSAWQNDGITYRIYLPDGSVKADADAFMEDLQLIHPLATPITYTVYDPSSDLVGVGQADYMTLKE